MTNYNENENDNEKTDHIDKTKIDQYVDIKAIIQNIACLCKIMLLMPLCNGEHLSNIWNSIH